MGKRVVIVGGGFGGVYAAKRLLRRAPAGTEILLIDRKNYVLYTPMLHEVATGGLNRHSVVEPIRSVLRGKNFRFWQCEATRIDFRKQQVTTRTGVLPYDVLLLAMGAKANFFGTPGAAEHTLTLKTIQDANRIRNHIIRCLEQAAKQPTRQAALLTFVVVGGGPTGVEVMGELVEFVQQMLKGNYHEIDHSKVRFILADRGSTLVPQIHPSGSAAIEKRLRKMGVEIWLQSAAAKVARDGVTLGREFIHSHTVIWTGGVTPNTIPSTPNALNEHGRYPVDEFLQIHRVKNAYAIGDCAAIRNPLTEKPVPDTAQSAVVEGKAVAGNICAALAGKPQKPFAFKQKGFLVSVGDHFGVAEIGPIRFSGFLAWWLMRTIYLSKMLGHAQKFKVAFEWTIRLFSKRDTTEI